MKRILALAIAALSFGNLYAQYSWNKLPTAIEPSFKKDTFNVLKFGAKADGVTLNTKSFNEAINVCSKKGGGIVFVPAGLWYTGPITLKSNVNLHLAKSAVILFSDNFDDYPLVEGNWEGKVQARNQSPISGENLENIAITGFGIIDGNGEGWRMIGKDRLTEREWSKKIASGGLVSADGKLWYPSAKTKKAHEEKLNGVITEGKTLKDFENIKDYLRPNLLVLTNCKKVLLQGVTFENSPAWNLHTLLCTDLTVRNVFVKTAENAQNGDGIDVESCKNVLIEDCKFDVGDDGICIKSGRDVEGRKRGKPTESVVVRNSTVYHAHGGFVIGSEMSGGAKNIFVYDCSFIGTDKGLRFKTARGRGGIVENIYCKNIYMKDIEQEAIYFDMYYFTKPPKPGEKVETPVVTEATPQFQNFYIDNIRCNGAEKGVFVRGLPEMSIKNINLSNLTLKVKKGVEIFEAENINIKNIELITGITKPMIYVENSKKILFDNLQYNKGAELLLSVNGSRTKGITFSNTNPSLATEKVKYLNEASEVSAEVKF